MITARRTICAEWDTVVDPGRRDEGIWILQQVLCVERGPESVWCKALRVIWQSPKRAVFKCGTGKLSRGVGFGLRRILQQRI